MKRKIIYIPLFLGLCSFTLQSFAGEPMSCEYAGKFEKCKVANQNGSSRSIKDFVCISSSKDEVILYQIIFDVEFRKIDNQIEAFLDKLKNDKEASAIDSNTVIDEIANNLIPPTGYYRQYRELCDGGFLKKMLTCGDKISLIGASGKIKGFSVDGSICNALVKNKLSIYSQVAYDTMKINKSDVREDRLQEGVVQQLRTKYDKLTDMMAAIIGNIGRLVRGLTYFTRDTY